MRQLATAALTLTLMTGLSTVALAADAGTAPTSAATTQTPSVQTPAATPAVSKPMVHRTSMVHGYRHHGSDERDTRALNLLEANGYAQIVQFHPDGKNFDATVMQGGKDVRVTVDPDSGRIQHRV